MPPPASRPVLSVESIGGRRAGLRIADALTPTRRARPAGARLAEIYARIGAADAAPPASVGECRFVGLARRSGHTIEFAGEQPGQSAWVIARWINAKGQAGPPSAPVRVAIAA